MHEVGMRWVIQAIDSEARHPLPSYAAAMCAAIDLKSGMLTCQAPLHCMQ